MADLEERALRRDRGFLVRLVIGLAVGLAFGLFVGGELTSSGFAGCASERLDGATD